MSKKALVFITGASSGFGQATAELFAKQGHPLVLLARRGDRLRAVANHLEKTYSVKIHTLVADVRNLAALQKEAELFPDLFSSPEVLINNAGLSRALDPLQEGSPQDWDEMIDTNIKGLLYITRLILPHFVKRGGGHVINIGSTASHWLYRGGNVYCATKHAVKALNEGMRLDVHGSGVRVTSIDPGMAETEFSVVRFHGDKDRADKVYQGMTPLSAQDVAEAIYWAYSRPAHVNIQEIILTPTDQSGISTVHRQ